MARECTSKLIEFAENESISWEDIARECLARMPEDDVRDMCDDVFDEIVNDDDDIDEEDIGDPEDFYDEDDEDE